MATKKQKQAQTAIEYLILLGVVTAIVLAGFSRYLPKVQGLALNVFNATTVGVMGAPATYDWRTGLGKARTWRMDYP